MGFSLSEYTKIDVDAYKRSPRLPSWFQGGGFAAGGEWRGGEGRTRGREGKGGDGGIAPWLLGLDAPGYMFTLHPPILKKLFH